MKRGDLVIIHEGYGSFFKIPVSENPNSKDNKVVDFISKNEISIILKVGVASIKIISPRGNVGWIWKPRIKTI